MAHLSCIVTCGGGGGLVIIKMGDVPLLLSCVITCGVEWRLVIIKAVQWRGHTVVVVTPFHHYHHVSLPVVGVGS